MEISKGRGERQILHIIIGSHLIKRRNTFVVVFLTRVVYSESRLASSAIYNI